jgi:hypothetical protein
MASNGFDSLKNLEEGLSGHLSPGGLVPQVAKTGNPGISSRSGQAAVSG